jgi:hypothetical protein
VRIIKVVVFSTSNPTKLSLHFSEFSTISRHFTSFCKVDILLKLRFCAEAPEKIQPLAMWPLAMDGGGAGPNSGDSAPESAREGRERG